MKDRWRGRRTGLTLVVALTWGVIAASLVSGRGQAAVVVSDDAGRVLARLSLGKDDAFSLRYRNSLYGTSAEERFVIMGDGRFRLDELVAEQVAVLEEYYAVSEGPTRAAPGSWRAPPAYTLELDRLTVAATDLGRRTLLVEGHRPLALWRLVDDAAPSVHLTVERAP
ncbi:MAG: hypothetical protein H0X59_00110 [Chloroflexi bacterium]|nr:hypothetical protein [Chloroflexota bacterium]